MDFGQETFFEYRVHSLETSPSADKQLIPDIMAGRNVICVKAWCARDNPLVKVVPGTPNRVNGIWGRCFLTKGQLSINAVQLDHLPMRNLSRTQQVLINIQRGKRKMASLRVSPCVKLISFLLLNVFGFFYSIHISNPLFALILNPDDDDQDVHHFNEVILVTDSYYTHSSSS